MTQKRLAHHISAIRRIQTRLGTYPKASPEKTTLLQGQATANLVATLNPKFKLCDFHPFSPGAEFDFDLFDGAESPGDFLEIPAQKNPLAEKQDHGQGGGDADANKSTYSFYHHISRLVVETEKIIANTTATTGSTDRVQAGLAINKGSSYLQDATSSQARYSPEQNYQGRNADNRSAFPGSVDSASSSQAKRNNNNKNRERSAPAKKMAQHDITVFQKITQNLQYLEQFQTKHSATTQLPVSAPLPGNIRRTDSTRSSSQIRLRSLTQSLLGGVEQPHLKLTDSVASPGQQKPRNAHVSASGHIKNKLQEFSDNLDQESIVPATNNLATNKGGSVQPDQTLGSLLPVDNTPVASGTEKNSVYSPRSIVSFQDIGRLEALKVADALSDYLQEQAGLHGVDLL